MHIPANRRKIHHANANELLHTKRCKRRTSERHQRNGLGAKYTKAASIIPAVTLLNFI
jgi:hypothetical protein